MPPSPYETDLTPEYQKLLEAARISTAQQRPEVLAAAMHKSVPTFALLPENRSAALAQRITREVENLIETAAATPLIEESKEPLLPISKPSVVLENVKIAATARIAKSLDDAENISKQKRIWLICSGVVVIGAVTATTIYCFNQKPKN